MSEARCHCGAVVLSFATYDTSEQGRCDCSICRRKGGPGVTVRAADLVVEKGDTLRLYTFGTHRAQHYFCGICGIHTHHRRSSDPDEFRVNAGCIEGFDVRSIDASWKADDTSGEGGTR